MDDFEGSESFTSFKELSGITVGVDDVIDEISKLPLDGILGFLAGLSLEMIQKKKLSSALAFKDGIYKTL